MKEKKTSLKIGHHIVGLNRHPITGVKIYQDRLIMSGKPTNKLITQLPIVGQDQPTLAQGDVNASQA